MAQLYPSNFDLTQMVQAEQRAAAQLLAHLDDSWFVVPQVAIVVNGADSEIDFVLVSPDHGIFCVEAKGGIITITDGQWQSNGKKIKNPVAQGSSAKHNLLRRLHAMKVDVSKMFLQNIVVLPDIIDFPAHGAGPDCPRDIVFTKLDLQNPHEQFARLRHRDAQPVSDAAIHAVLKALRPDVREIEVDGRYAVGVSQRIDKMTQANLDVLLPLDVNSRIFVEGAAGTGKTYLAHHWTRRALHRGERTLFVCYNRALGNELYGRMEKVLDDVPDASLLRTGSFHSIANSVLRDLAPVVPADADQEFWDTAHADLLVQHRDSIPTRFDTIIIDEGQDFQPAWFSALEGLLADPAQGRFYVMTDPLQAIFADPLHAPAGVTRVPLTVNIRNARHIARVVTALGGAAVPAFSSPGPHVDYVEAGGGKERRKKIAAAIAKAHEELNIPLSQILVAVPHRADVAELIGAPAGNYTLCAWQDRSEDTVACSTIQGSKGLEFPAVIVCNMDTEPDPRLTYIGASRASVYLALIGSAPFIEQVAPRREPSATSDRQTVADA